MQTWWWWLVLEILRSQWKESVERRNLRVVLSDPSRAFQSLLTNSCCRSSQGRPKSYLVVSAALPCWDSRWKGDTYLLVLGCYWLEKLGQFEFRKMDLKVTAWNDKSVRRFVRNLCFCGAGSRSRKFRGIPLSRPFPKEKGHVQKSVPAAETYSAKNSFCAWATLKLGEWGRGVNLLYAEFLSGPRL